MGRLSLWQVAKDLGLIAMGMSRCGVFDFGLTGAAATLARPARRAIVSIFEPHRQTSAYAFGRGLAFAMTGLAGGT